MNDNFNQINELCEAIRKMAKDGTVRTHSVNCWQWHLPCAALWAADLLETSLKSSD
jgi:hypothetical protein